MPFLSKLHPFLFCTLAALAAVTSCSSPGRPTRVVTDGVVVSVRDQRMAVLRDGAVVKTYPVSTSKFGLGDRKGSNCTPLGHHSVAAKFGGNMPLGAVFKNRRPTGEIVGPDSPGRDPIVSRIIWLRGHEARNRNAYSRLIYIHGTTEERLIGTPASYGCIRMRSRDIHDLYSRVGKGDPVVVELCSLKASTEAAMLFVRNGAARDATDKRLAVSKPARSKPSAHPTISRYGFVRADSRLEGESREGRQTPAALEKGRGHRG